MDSTNADALYVRGLCLYYEDCIEKAVQFFVQALRMAPDHEKACLACRVNGGDGAAKSPGFGVFLNPAHSLVLLDLIPSLSLIIAFPRSPGAGSVFNPCQRQPAAASDKTKLLETISQQIVIL